MSLEKLLFSAAVLLRHGNTAGAFAEYQRAARAEPGNAQAWSGLGSCHFLAARFEDARDAFARAAKHAPNDIDIACLHIVALAKSGAHGPAREEIRRLATLVGGEIFLIGSLGDRMLDLRDPEAALTVTRLWEETFPASVAPLAARAVALQALNRDAEYQQLMSVQTLLGIIGNFHRVPALRDHANLNDALARSLQAADRVDVTRERKATKAGDQTRHLDPRTQPAVKTFYAGLAVAVDDYVRRVVEAVPDHPWVKKRPAKFNIVAWGVLLREQGYQNPHVHPSGWLSGVYYPRLPAGAVAEEPSAGWLEFGTPSAQGAGAFVTRQLVKPAEGTLALFPSYFWHRTGPAKAHGRMSLAFDIGAPGKGHPLA